MDFNATKIIPWKEVSVSIINDNNVFIGSTFVISRFTYYLNLVKTEKMNLSLFLTTSKSFQVMKQITKKNGEPFPKRKLVSVQNIEHKG